MAGSTKATSGAPVAVLEGSICSSPITFVAAVLEETVVAVGSDASDDVAVASATWWLTTLLNLSLIHI